MVLIWGSHPLGAGLSSKYDWKDHHLQQSLSKSFVLFFSAKRLKILQYSWKVVLLHHLF